MCYIQLGHTFVNCVNAEGFLLELPLRLKKIVVGHRGGLVTGNIIGVWVLMFVVLFILEQITGITFFVATDS